MSQGPELAWTGPLDALGDEDRRSLLERTATVPQEVRDQVDEMAATIAQGGDAALLDYTERFDEVVLDELTVPQTALSEAYEQADGAFLDALDRAVDQVRAYHETVHRGTSATFEQAGVRAYEHAVPLARVGAYVPGGQAAYPSTVVMTVVPAQVAGVAEIIVASPPGPDGLPHPLVLAACHALGVEHVVPLGGAQAILALAYGTASVPRCQAVVGPGNAYVQAAKQHAAGRVRIDGPAGPSEVAALIGPTADPAVAARELIAQAEHAPDTLAVGICLSQDTATHVREALTTCLEDHPRAEIVTQALAQQGALLVAGSLGQAEAFLNELAPEHCVLLHQDADTVAKRLVGPACVVAGPRPRVAQTDYAAGPSHVLPTGGHAAAYSGISTATFTKRVHVVHLDDVDEALSQAAVTLARLEGLEGHARAIEEGGP